MALFRQTLLLIALAALAYGNEYSVYNEQGGCYQDPEGEPVFLAGHGANESETNTIKGCYSACKNTQNCSYFTFGHYERKMECHLLSACEKYGPDKRFTAYQMGTAYVVHNEGGCIGDSSRFTPKGKHHVHDVQECANICGMQKKCMYFAVSTYQGVTNVGDGFSDSDSKDYKDQYYCHTLQYCNKNNDKDWISYTIAYEDEDMEEANHHSHKGTGSPASSQYIFKVDRMAVGSICLVAVVAMGALLYIQKAKQDSEPLLAEHSADSVKFNEEVL